MKTDFTRFGYLTSEIEAVYHEAAIKVGLSDSALRILYAVCLQGDGCLLSEIVRLSGISKQTINSALRKLEKGDILRLERAGGNKKKVFFTERGKTLSKNSAMRVIGLENEVLSSWTKSERETYLALTEKFLSAFGEKVKTEL